MPTDHDESRELDPADFELEEESGETETAETLALTRGQKSRSVAPRPKAAEDTEHTLPPADQLILEARRRAEAQAQSGDKIALARARTELAILLEVLGKDPPAALAEYRAAHALAPLALAPIAGARRLTPSRPIAPAIALLESEIRATGDPRSLSVRYAELGRLYLALGNSQDKAVSAFRDSLARNSVHPAALRGLESTLRSQPKESASEALCDLLESMAQAWSNDRSLAAWLYVERAQAFDRMGKADAARESFEAAMCLDASSPVLELLFTRHLVAQDRVAHLVDVWDAEATRLGPTARAARHCYLAGRMCSERLEKVARALELHERVADNDAADEVTKLSALRELARLYAVSGDQLRAVEARRRILPLLGSDAALAHHLRRLAKTMEGLSRWEELAACAEQALRLDPDDDETRERLDRALCELDLHEERLALWTAEAARQVAPARRAASLLSAAAVAEQKLGRPELSLLHLRGAWAADAGNIAAAAGIERLLHRQTPRLAKGALRARIDYYAEAAARAPDQARKIAELERLAHLREVEQQDAEAALAVYREILELDPKHRGALLGAQRNSARSGNHRELYRALLAEADLAQEPLLARALLLRAADVACEHLNDSSAALDLTDRVLRKHPGDPGALRTAYKIHERTGRLQEAREQLKLLLAHARKGQQAFSICVEMAILLEERMRKPLEAIAAYREASRLDPDNPVPFEEVRRLLSSAGDHRQLADELLKMSGAMKSPGDRAKLLLEAAEVYDDRLNEVERAVPLLVSAQKLLPELEIVEDRLERAYLRLGRGGDLAVLLEQQLTVAQGEARNTLRFALASMLAEDRNLLRAATLLEEIVHERPRHVPALRLLEQVLRKMDRPADLAAVLRKQAAAFEHVGAKVAALSELAYLEEHRGVTPGDGEVAALEMVRRLLPDDLLVQEQIVRAFGIDADDPSTSLPLAASLGIVGESTSDTHHGAAMHLCAALLLESAAEDNEHLSRPEAMRRYGLALTGWPECLTAARGLSRLSERLGDREAQIQANVALGTLETAPTVRAQRLTRAAHALAEDDGALERAAHLFARALAEYPESAEAAEGIFSLVSRGLDAGKVVDPVRRALDRATGTEQVARLGNGLAILARTHLDDPTVAREALRRVRKKAPGHVPSLLALAEANAALSLWADAAECAANALAITRSLDERVRGLLLLAEAHLRVPASREEGAREAREAEQLIRGLAPDQRATSLCLACDMYGRISDRESQNRSLVRALLLAPESPLPLRKLADVHPESGEAGALAQATILRQCIDDRRRSGDNVPSVWLSLLGRLEALRLSMPGEGLSKILDAIGQDPSRTEGYEELANAHAALGSHDEAVRTLLGLLEGSQAASLDAIATLLALLAREYQACKRPLQASVCEEVLASLRLSTRDRVIAEKAALFRARSLPKARPPEGALDHEVLASTLLPADARTTLVDVGRELREIWGKLWRPDPGKLGLSSRASRSDSSIQRLSERLAPAFGAFRYELVQDAPLVSVPRLAPAEVPLLLLPRGFGDLPEAEQGAGLCRMFALLALDAPYFDELSLEETEGLLLGALRVGNDRFGVGTLSPAKERALEPFRNKIGKAISRRGKRALEEIAQRTSATCSLSTYREGLRLAAFRSGFLVTGNLLCTLDHVFRVERDCASLPRDQGGRALLQHPLTRALILYALSNESLPQRRALGTST